MCRCAAAHEQRPAPLNKKRYGAMPLKTRLKPKCHDGIKFGLLKKETRQTFGLHEHSRIGPTKTKSATSLEVNISRLPGVFEHHVFKDRKNLWGIRGTPLPRTLDGGNP